MLKEASILVMIISLGVIAYSCYYFFVNVYSSPVNFERALSGSYYPNFSNSETSQYYPNMRFKTGRISYYLGSECPKEKVDNMLKAFRYLENRTLNKLEFYEASGGEIEVRCGKEYEAASQGFFVAGEGGPTQIINGSLFNVILSGQILLLYSESCSYNVEIHELLHVLGFEHSSDTRSIMHNVTSCNQVLTEDIASELVGLYSFESLPDLYFSEVSASKKGMYLNLNFSIRNRGLADAGNVSVALFANDVRKKEFALGRIGLGEGRMDSIINARIPLSTLNLTLAISGGREIYSGNNRAFLSLQNDN